MESHLHVINIVLLGDQPAQERRVTALALGQLLLQLLLCFSCKGESLPKQDGVHCTSHAKVLDDTKVGASESTSVGKARGCECPR